jgi:hypothetical protein
MSKKRATRLFLNATGICTEDKLIRDSVFICDTIRVPYPVEVVKNVKAKRSLPWNIIYFPT